MTSKAAPSIAFVIPPAPAVESPSGDLLPLESPPSTTGAGFPPPEALHLLNNGPPMYMASLDGRLIYVNQQYHRLQQLMAEKRAGFLATDGIPAFPITEIIREVVANGHTTGREDVVESASDTEFFSSQHYPVHDEHGNLFAVAGIYQNTTREARAWIETLAARDRFRDVARLVLDGIWETDPAFNFTYLSPRILDVLKMHPRHLQGTNLFSLGHFRQPEAPPPEIPPTELDADTPSHPVPDRSMRASFRDALFEIVNKNGDARLFVMSGLPMFDERTGTFKGFRGTARDITAETTARRAAARIQRRLTYTIENISEGLALRDSRGRLTLCNSKFRSFFAPIDDSLVIKTPFAHILAAAQNADIAVQPKNAFAKWIAQAAPGCRLAEPLEIQISDGRWVKIAESRSAKGAVQTTISDITEIKFREEARIAAKLVAERASRSKGEFLANMSHELRTPLNAIIGFSEIMRTETFGPLGSPRYQGYIKDIHDSSRHLLGVINDILDISKSEAGKLQLNEDTVDLIDEIRNASRLFNEQAFEGQLALVLDLPQVLPPVWADARKIKQVLLNLVSNAVKFTPAGGTVSIRLHHEAESGDIIIAVSDTGIGIDESDIEKVFSAFGQVENSLSRRHEGTGLGLPLSQALVEMHGGTLTLTSKLGAGTTATMRLPASRLRA